VGGRSRGRFATPADFPQHDCSPYRRKTYAANVWDLSIVQGPFSVAPCQTLANVRFANFPSLQSTTTHAHPPSRPARGVPRRRRVAAPTDAHGLWVSPPLTLMACGCRPHSRSWFVGVAPTDAHGLWVSIGAGWSGVERGARAGRGRRHVVHRRASAVNDAVNDGRGRSGARPAGGVGRVAVRTPWGGNHVLRADTPRHVRLPRPRDDAAGAIQPHPPFLQQVMVTRFAACHARTTARSERKLDQRLTLWHPINSTFGLLGSWFAISLSTYYCPSRPTETIQHHPS
jgi:hypothetical protein